MDRLRVSLVQTPIFWEDRTANLASLEEKLWPLKGLTDLVVLPEMFTTGFSMNTSLAEPVNFTTTKWMKQMARQLGASVTGSVMIKDQGMVYNRLLWVFPDGQVEHYDKRHLFSMAGENDHFSSGDKQLVVDYKGWKIRPLICYDLRFPVWSRNTNTYEADLLLYVANWPEPRTGAWTKLIDARAIENLAYCLGVNRIGTDGVNKSYNGQSKVVDFKGEIAGDCRNEDTILTIELSKSILDSFRKKFPAHLDADEFHINP